MSSQLLIDKTRDLIEIENEKGNPTFEFNGNSYNFIPSITMFNRDLEMGGFQMVQLMSATVRLNDIDDEDNLSPIFTSGLPQPQNIIVYSVDKKNYRIESIKLESDGSYMRIIAHSTTRGT